MRWGTGAKERSPPPAWGAPPRSGRWQQVRRSGRRAAGGQSHAHKDARQAALERRQRRSPGGQLGCLGDSPLRLGDSPLGLGDSPLRMNTPTWGR
jgi:hypothetical protein